MTLTRPHDCLISAYLPIHHMLFTIEMQYWSSCPVLLVIYGKNINFFYAGTYKILSCLGMSKWIFWSQLRPLQKKEAVKISAGLVQPKYVKLTSQSSCTEPYHEAQLLIVLNTSLTCTQYVTTDYLSFTWKT